MDLPIIALDQIEDRQEIVLFSNEAIWKRSKTNIETFAKDAFDGFDVSFRHIQGNRFELHPASFQLPQEWLQSASTAMHK